MTAFANGPYPGQWIIGGISNDPEVNGTKIYWSNNARFEKMRYFCWDVSLKVFAEYSAKSPQFKTIHDNYMGYRDQVVPWFRLAEASYDQYVGAALSRQK